MTSIDVSSAKLNRLMQPYCTKRHGLTLTNCDSEPVKTPGCVQAHGALMVLRVSDLRILQASDNAQEVLGHSCDMLLGQFIGVVLGASGQNRLQAVLANEPTHCNPIYLLSLPGIGDGSSALDVTVHTVDEVAVLEFESTGRTSGEKPDHYAFVKNSVGQLQNARSLRQFCDGVAGDIRELTGLDRVMIYKFHADGHGEVLAESRRADLSSWLGLHYPAEDIPKPAREIFMKTWIRPVPDVSDELAELVPLLNPDTGKPLDMTYCALRGVSIMYTEYLRNMDVTAALTMAIRHDEQLWGLIACHHYAGAHPVSYQVRAACEFLAQVVSLQHQAAENKEHVAYRVQIENVHQTLMAAATREGGLINLVNGTPSLLQGIDAGGAALLYLGRWWCVGTTPTEDELEGLGDWLNDTVLPGCARPLYATDRLAQAYAPAAAFSNSASGLLAVPLALKRRELMLWFRPETIQTVNWGGDPDDKPRVLGPNGPRLTPRRSFDLFAESVRQRALPWKAVEIEAAASLRLLAAELVDSRAAKRVTLQTDLVRSNEDLDAFAYVASHDLKEPLRGIHRYAHQLLEDAAPVDGENRQKLDGLVRLTLRMDSLLDSLLNFSRVGGDDLQLEIVDLNELLTEALELIGSRTSDVKSEVVVPRQLPAIDCDRMRCRQIFANLLSNAFKYSDAALKRVEVGVILAGERHPRPGSPPGVQEQSIYYVADNGIGIPVKHFDKIFKLFKRLHAQGSFGGGTGAGLTIVRKLVEQQGGQVWVDSEVGQGTTFYFTLRAQAGALL
jgi:chemotaxis family two-component system sensor kinase Cph1